MIETPRLTLLPLTLDQLRLHVADSTQLEASLRLVKGHRKVVEPLLSVIVHFTVPRLRDPARDPLYNTVWIAIDRQKQQIVADAKFKGEPDETGTVEIGYGTYPAFQRQGYMAEMVGNMVRWASQQPGVLRVVADTDAENVGSQKVLAANGFRLFDQIEDMLWWEYIFDSPQSLVFDEYGYLTPYEVQQVTRETIIHTFLTNSHRQTIWSQYIEFERLMIARQIPVLTVWMDGSFVSQKELPNDLDVVWFVDASYLSRNYRALDQVRNQFPLLHILFAEYHVADTSTAQAINRIEKFKWFSLFSSKNRQSKGFLELRINV